VAQLVHDIVRKTQLQLDRVALNLGAVTHADQVQLAFEALAHAGHHVGDQGAQGARHRVGMAAVVGNDKGQLAVFLGDVDVASQRLHQGAQRALDGNLVRLDAGFNTLGQFYRVFSDT